MTTTRLVRHLFQGLEHCDRAIGGELCGSIERDWDLHYMSQADLWRAARAPQLLPDAFAPSMRYWLHANATMIPIHSRDNWRTDPFTTALRAAIGKAEEWRDLATASKELGHEELSSLETADIRRAGYAAGSNHQAVYCANMLLRTIAEYTFADAVSEKERYA